MSRTITSKDDAKVSKQDKRTIREFMIFFNDELNKDNKYTVTDFDAPDDLFSPYDLKFVLSSGDNDLGYTIELKERTLHYKGTYRIDERKIQSLLSEAEKRGDECRLIITEPAYNNIWFFDLRRIDWEKIERKWEFVLVSTAREESKDKRQWKWMYYLPWTEAKHFYYDGWSEETARHIQNELDKRYSSKNANFSM